MRLDPKLKLPHHTNGSKAARLSAPIHRLQNWPLTKGKGRKVKQFWGLKCAKTISNLDPNELSITDHYCNAQSNCEWMTMRLDPKLKLSRHTNAPKSARLYAPIHMSQCGAHLHTYGLKTARISAP